MPTPTPSPDAVVPQEDSALQRLCRGDALFVERYDGWEEVGSGGFGTVIRTYCRDTDTEVALKILPRLDSEGRQQLRAEARTLARIVHSHVVRTYAGFDRGGVAWLEMEYVAGTTLGRELRLRRDQRRTWSLREALAIAAAAAEGLAAVHAAGVVHRDVKPDNVLLPASGQPAAKVADFGIARLLDEPSRTRTGDFNGSPRYGAPELWAGERAGPPADVYALGITLYQLMSGGLYPYALPEDAMGVALIKAHTRTAPLPLGSVVTSLPEAVIDVVTRMLSKSLRQRPSAHAVARVFAAQLPRAQDAPLQPVARSRWWSRWWG